MDLYQVRTCCGFLKPSQHTGKYYVQYHLYTLSREEREITFTEILQLTAEGSSRV